MPLKASVGKPLRAREMEEKENDAGKCMRGERVKNSLSFPSFGKRYSGFPFSSFPRAQGPLHRSNVKVRIKTRAGNTENRNKEK
jgi:hypothetical protein